MTDRERSRSPDPASSGGGGGADDHNNSNNNHNETSNGGGGGGGNEPSGDEIKLYVGNLDYATDETKLRDEFGQFGTVTDVFLPVERGTSRPRGFGFVTMGNRASAESAISKLDQSQLDGRTIRVNESRPKGESAPGGAAGGGGRGGGGGFNAAGNADVRKKHSFVLLFVNCCSRWVISNQSKPTRLNFTSMHLLTRFFTAPIRIILF